MRPHDPAAKSAAAPAADAARGAVRLAAIALSLAALAAYANSFAGVFVLDDLAAIPNNESLRELTRVLAPPSDSTTFGRPIGNLTFAIDRAWNGDGPWGYHATNLLIHLLAALALFGLVRRTLSLPRLAERFGADALPLALAAAALWMLHPLQTESVTYVVQRVESLAGLFALATLYAFVRGVESPSPARWFGASVLACLLAMGSKESAAAAPLLVLLYDRTLVAGSFREALRRRAWLYVALAATWLPLAWLVVGSHGRSGTAGFGTEITSGHYLLTQCGAIVHYLRLAVWPRPLVFDYGTSVVTAPLAVAPQAVLLVALAAATAWAVAKRSAWGLLGIAFFALLAPSSSFVPVATQTVAEHRMYLPLAALAVAAVSGAYAWLGRRSLLLWPLLALVLGALTVARNRDYHSAERLWRDTAEKRADNPRAFFCLGRALFQAGRADEAIASYEQALRLDPEYAAAHDNLGIALAAAGRTEEARAHFEASVRADPERLEGHNNWGIALASSGRLEAAVAQFEAALRVDPEHVEAQTNLAAAFVSLGRTDEAFARLQEILRRHPDHAGANKCIAGLLAARGQLAEAAARYEASLRSVPDSLEALTGLGDVLIRMQRFPEALTHGLAAVRLRADSPAAQNTLGAALLFSGRAAEAIEHLETAVRLAPGLVKPRHFLGNAYAMQGRVDDARASYEAALRIDPGFEPSRKNLALLPQR